MIDTNLYTNSHSYEMVCSLGERCMTAHQMRLNKLRSESNPFDWLITTNITAVVDTLLNNWNNFFKRENLVVQYVGPEHTNVMDSTTGFLSLHDFNSAKPFDEEYDRFITKYTRRINRLMELICTSKSILFVRTNATEVDIENLQRLKTLNPSATIDFLIVNTTNTTSVRSIPSKYDNVYIYEISDQPDLAYDVWMGNHAHWKEVLSNYSLIGYQDFLVQALKQYTKEKTLVIWGFGGAGRKIVAHLTTTKDSVPIGWIVDRNPAKVGKISEILEVKDITSLQSHTSDVFVLICIYGDTTEIEKTLKDMNFSQESYKKVLYDGLTPVGVG